EERARRARGVAVGRLGDTDRRQLILDIVAERLPGILVEPLGRKIVGGVAAAAPPFRGLHVHGEVEQGEVREGDHSVAEGQPRAEEADMEGGGLERELHRNAGMTSFAKSSSSRMMCRCGIPGKKTRQIRCVIPYCSTKGLRSRMTWSGLPIRKRSFLTLSRSVAIAASMNGCRHPPAYSFRYETMMCCSASSRAC